MMFFCPHCNQSLEADEQLGGQSIECPVCGKSFVIPVPKATTSTKAGTPERPAVPTENRAAQTRRPGPRMRPPLMPVTSYSAPKKRIKPGFGNFLFLLLVLAAAGFGGAMIYFDESPQQVWKRFAELIGGSEKPSPAPTSAPSPTPTPTPTPEPAPTPAPTVAHTTDPLAWLVAHRDYWPKEVALLKATDFPAVFGGKTSGYATVPAGTMVGLAEITGESVGVVYIGGGARIPIDSTDLRRRAGAAMAKAAADAIAAEAAPPVPAATPEPEAAAPIPGSLIATTVTEQRRTVAEIARRMVKLSGSAQLYISGTGDPLPGSSVNFLSQDAWLFLEKIRPSEVASNFLSRMQVNGAPAVQDKNVRVVQYEQGTVVIPHEPDYPAMTVFDGKSFTGSSKPLRCYTQYDDTKLGAMKSAISSFRLKRGYMATIAQEENGTGISRNYVAQDHDIEVKSLPSELDNQVRFVRVFPWRWVSKKGVAGGIWQNLNVGWYYNWNISDNSSLDLEYVPIKQKRWWPGLRQDWKARGATHLLGYNEPDHKDQSDLTVDDAIAGWPDLLGTGLRIGSPAVSDGGLGWLFEFMEKADAANLRVDFVAVHYYRAVPPGDAKAAARQFYSFLKGIHDRTKRPIWVTEWNNGANWTNAGDPTETQQKRAVAEMIKMLDDTPFVERYAIYNWVEEVRNVQRKDGSLTPAGEVYRDKESPLSYIQARP
jgi:hypothetical protein